MLNLIIGPAKSGKTTFLMNKLRELTQNRIIIDDILVLQPSIEACKTFHQELTGWTIPGIDVSTFRTFSSNLIESNEYEKTSLKFGFTVFLDFAINFIIKNHKGTPEADLIGVWNQSGSKTTLHQTLSDLIREGVTPEKLRGICKINDDEEITTTCAAIALLIEKYDSILDQHGFYNEVYNEKIAADIILNTRTNVRKVFVDNFNRFTQTQLDLLKVLSKTADVFLSVNCDCENKDCQFFQYSNGLINRIESTFDVDAVNKIVLNDRMQETSSDLKFFEMNYDSDASHDDFEDIEVIQADSSYEEITKVAIEIKHLLASGTYTLDDIAIVYRSNDPYNNIASAIFDKYDIPLRHAAKSKLINQPIFSYFLKFIEILEDYETNYSVPFSEIRRNNLISFLTSDFTHKLIVGNTESKITDHDIHKFVEKYRETGLFSFSLMSDALSDETSDESYAYNRALVMNSTDKLVLSAINKILAKYADKLADDDFVRSTFLTFCDINNVPEFIKDKFNEIIDVYSKIKSTSLILSKFLRMVANEIPVTAKNNRHGILCGNIASIHLSKIKAVFIVGLNQDKFPISVPTSPFISDKLKIVISKHLMLDVQSSFQEFEDFLFYKAITASHSKLYLCYSKKKLDGSSCNPSIYLYRNICKNLVNNPRTYSLSQINLQGFHIRTFIQNSLENVGVLNEKNSAELKTVFYDKDIDIINSLLERHSLETVQTSYEHKNYRIPVNVKKYINLSEFSNKIINKRIAISDLIFSNSNLKNYLTCPYRFLVESIYKIKEIKSFDIDAGEWGNLFHTAMEEFAYQVASFLQSNTFVDLIKFKEHLINSTISITKNKFHNQFLIFEDKSIYRKFEKFLDEFRKYLGKEIDRRIAQKASPAAVELAFGIPFNEATKTPKVIDKIKSKHEDCLEIDNGSHAIKIRGFIDLVDEVTVDDEIFYLIIDYKKTASFDKYIEITNWLKFHNLEEVWVSQGLIDSSVIPILNFQYVDLQLPIYLLAMKRVFSVENANSALFYHLFNRGFAGFIESDLSNKVTDSFYTGNLFRNVTTTLTPEEIDSLLKSSEKLIINLVELMKSGVFPISPDISHPSSYSPCDYCPYTAICRINSN